MEWVTSTGKSGSASNPEDTGHGALLSSSWRLAFALRALTKSYGRSCAFGKLPRILAARICVEVEPNTTNLPSDRGD
jgi:hypothetical protein